MKRHIVGRSKAQRQPTSRRVNVGCRFALDRPTKSWLRRELQRMSDAQEWRAVYDFWFPPGLDDANPEAHRRMFGWWFGGGANGELPPFAPLMAAARAGSLDHWLSTPRGRLSLIIVLDQFPRGLFAGTPEAYAGDPASLRIAEEGLRNGHYDALTRPWEKTFFFMPLAHTEGPDHLERLNRVAALAEILCHRSTRALAAALPVFRQPGPRPSRRDFPLRQISAPQWGSRAGFHSRGSGISGKGRVRSYPPATGRLRAARADYTHGAGVTDTPCSSAATR